MIDVPQIQQEYNPWRERNFPTTDSSQQLLGMMEELGELSHSYLKMRQGIRGTEDDHKTNMVDAIGDVSIYLLGYLQLRGIEWDQIHRHSSMIHNSRLDDPQHCLFQMARTIGKIANWQDISNIEPQDKDQPPYRETITRLCGNLVGWLRQFAHCYGWSHNQILFDTWQNVKQRDWIANPTDGSAPPEPSPFGRAPLDHSGSKIHQHVSGLDPIDSLDDLEDAQSQGHSG